MAGTQTTTSTDAGDNATKQVSSLLGAYEFVEDVKWTQEAPANPPNGFVPKTKTTEVICRVYRRPVMYPYVSKATDSERIWVAQSFIMPPKEVVGGTKSENNPNPNELRWNNYVPADANNPNKTETNYPDRGDGASFFNQSSNFRSTRHWTFEDALTACKSQAMSLVPEPSSY